MRTIMSTPKGYAVVQAIAWGTLMVIVTLVRGSMAGDPVTPASFLVAVMVWSLAALLFGALMYAFRVWQMRRQERRTAQKLDQ